MNIRFVSSSLLPGLLLSACGSPAMDANDANGANGAVEEVQAADPLLGMWQFETDLHHWTDVVGQWTNVYRGTFVVESTNQEGRYDISLNFTEVHHIGTAWEGRTAAQETCLGLLSGQSLSIQCQIDQQLYPNWMPADFNFTNVNAQSNEMGGILINVDNLPVRAWKN